MARTLVSFPAKTRNFLLRIINTMTMKVWYKLEDGQASKAKFEEEADVDSLEKQTNKEWGNTPFEYRVCFRVISRIHLQVGVTEGRQGDHVTGTGSRPKHV